MATLANIFVRHGPAYLGKHGSRVPAAHRKVMKAVTACRTGELGHAVYRCDGCGAERVMNRSCGDRHCPTCQHDKADRWLDAQTAKLLPCPYFMVTFTVPEEIRRFMRSNSGVCYRAFFAAAAGALKTLARDEKFIGATDIGFTAVLHTWGRQLVYHPHIHVIVPGGGLTPGGEWRPSHPRFLVPVFALSPLVRGKFKSAMKRAGLLGKIDPVVWTKGWNVQCEPVGGGENALRYVARYVFKIAISNSRIVSCDDDTVRFTYKDKKTDRTKVCRLEALEFMRRFLQHVLPRGFTKVRHYGFLHPNFRQSINEVRRAVCQRLEVEPEVAEVSKPQAGTRVVVCPRCGRPMKFVAMIRIPVANTG